MADPLHDKDLKENSLGCLMKSPRLIVSNELNTSRVTRCWPQKHFPLHPISQRSKKIPLQKSISLVLIGSESICESVRSETTGSCSLQLLITIPVQWYSFFSLRETQKKDIGTNFRTDFNGVRAQKFPRTDFFKTLNTGRK